MRVIRGKPWVVLLSMVLGAVACMPASRQTPLAPGKPRDLEHLTSA